MPNVCSTGQQAFAAAKPILTQIARAHLEGLAGKSAWTAVQQITCHNQELLERLGALKDADLLKYDKKDVLDMVKLSAAALKSLLQLVLQTQQLGRLQGTIVNTLYRWTYALARVFFVTTSEPAREAAVARLLTASGGFDWLAYVLLLNS